jgi:hypothetical protein
MLGIVAADYLATLIGAADGASAMGKIGFTAFAVNNVGHCNTIVGAAHAFAGPGSLFLGDCHDVYLV